MVFVNQTTQSFMLLLSLILMLLLPVWALSQTTIRFAALGDYGDDNADELAVANLVDSLGPDFVVTTGDNSYGSTPIDDNIGQYYSNYIGDYVGNYGQGSPINRFFPSLGNHDWGDGGGINAYLAYFTLPGNGIPGSNTSGNERYYDFIRGPVHFFAIDSDNDEPDGRDSTSIQGQWLKAQLAAATSTWKIVLMHHPPYSSGSHGSETIMQWPYENWGATAIICGHDHNYERIIRDDNNDGTELPYFVTGLGGRGIRNFGTPVPGSVVRYNGNFGTMLITASETEILFEFYSIDSSGTLIDSYTITNLAVPNLVVTPPSHHFGEVAACSSAIHTFVVKNTGTGDLEVTATAITGPNSLEFSILSGGAPFTLGNGETRSLTVAFSPLSPGNKTAHISFHSNNPGGNPFQVPISGNGMGQANILGDVTGDNLVNSTDALAILSYDTGIAIPPEFEQRINAGLGDVNSDGLTNSTDVLAILSYNVGIPVPFPVGNLFCR